MSAINLVKSQIEKISLALNTSDVNIMDELKFDVSTNVRRALAKNRNTPGRIINRLAFDPALNVSFIALQNRNCTVQRDLRECANHPCVSCTNSESSLNCNSCNKIKNFKY